MSLPKDPKNQDVFSSEYIMDYYKDVKLEDMDKEDLFHRYIVMGSDEEQNDPIIQRALIKNGYAEEFIGFSGVKFITDKEVIDGIKNSNIFENKNIKLIRGKVENIEFREPDDELDDFNYATINFKEKDTSQELLIIDLCYKPDNDKYKDEILKYKDDITAIIEYKNNENHLMCFLKKV